MHHRYQCSDKQHFTGSFANVGNGNGDEPQNDKWNREIKEFTEDAVERYKYTNQRSWKEMSDCDS